METALGLIAALAIIWLSIYNKQKERTDTLRRGDTYFDRDTGRFEFPEEMKVDSPAGETAKGFVGGIASFLFIGLVIVGILSLIF